MKPMKPTATGGHREKEAALLDIEATESRSRIFRLDTLNTVRVACPFRCIVARLEPLRQRLHCWLQLAFGAMELHQRPNLYASCKIIVVPYGTMSTFM